MRNPLSCNTWRHWLNRPTKAPRVAQSDLLADTRQLAAELDALRDEAARFNGEEPKRRKTDRWPRT